METGKKAVTIQHAKHDQDRDRAQGAGTGTWEDKARLRTCRVCVSVAWRSMS